MKNQRLMLFALMIFPLLLSGCIAEEPVSEPMTNRAASLVSSPSTPDAPDVVVCSSDVDCGPGNICDGLDPGNSMEKFCVTGCRDDSQCGVAGICTLQPCEFAPCGGTCTTSEWQRAIDILGFEDASNWTATSGTDSASSDAVQGNSALAVNGPGWQFVVTSAPFGPLPKVDDDVSIAIKLPVEQPNPWWYGQLQLFVESPSLGLYNRFIAVAELTGLPTGEYVTVDFPLPADVKTLLQGDYNDLKITIALNVPYNATGQYLLDDLRFGDDIVPPVLSVATSDSPKLGSGPFETFKEDITLLGHVEENVGIADVSVSVDGGAVNHPVVDSEGNFDVPLTLDRDLSTAVTTYDIYVSVTDTAGYTTELTTQISVISPAVPNELIVIFNKDTSDAHRNSVLADISGTLSRKLNDFTWLITVPAGTAPSAVQSVGAPTPIVRAVYPNILLKAQEFIPNDSFLADQTEYLNSINAFEAWDIERGSDEVLVAVVDSGVDLDMFIGDVSQGECGGVKSFKDNVYLNEKECCENPPCLVDDENSCIPSSNPDSVGACPVADLNRDGCPGRCGVDDDGDGAADMQDPDVIKLFSNGYDDDGDGNVDEQAYVGGAWISCLNVLPGDLIDAPANGDCDGAANDDDENGYPDDCRGWNFGRIILPSCSDITDPETEDCVNGSELTHPNQMRDLKMWGNDRHGTDVALIIGAPADDCANYAGLAHNVKILPLGVSRFLPNTRGDLGILVADIALMIEAYQYAAKAGAHIINSSISKSVENYDAAEFWAQYPFLQNADRIQLVTDLLNLSGTDSILHVIAAGNDGENIDNEPNFPARAQIENKLVVGMSVPANDGKPGDSNYGLEVDLAAPGFHIGGAFGWTGTSYAAPMVAGTAALLMSHNPELRGNPSVVADIIRGSVRHSTDWEGISKTEGVLDTLAALQAVVPEPLFINISSFALPSQQDNATDDVDLFDANNDGKLDILEVSCSRENVKTQPHLFINSIGVFGDRTVDMMPQFEGSFCDAAEGDLDDDGFMDIVLAAHSVNGSSGDNQNRVLMNTGSGFTLNDSLLPTSDLRTRSVALCDYDSDGDLDIYFGNVSATLFDAPDMLLRNNGGNFTDVTAVMIGTTDDRSAAHKIICADLDAPPANLCDGLNASECKICADPTVSIDGEIARGGISSAIRNECRAARQKVVPEFVIAGGEGTMSLLLRQDEFGVYQEVSCELNLPMLDGTPVTCADGVIPGRQDYDVETGDFNNDGAPDLVFVSRSGNPNPSNNLLFNNGDGTFSDVTNTNWNIQPDDSREVEVGDVNNDGWDDIIVIRGNPNTMNPGANTLYMNQGDGSFQINQASGLRTDASITTDGELADIDNDGDLDLLLGNFGEANLLMRNTTN